MFYHAFIDSLHDKDSFLGYSGVMLMFSSTFFADMNVVIGSLAALGGLVLLIYNILIKIKEYKIKRIELNKLENNINEKDI